MNIEELIDIGLNYRNEDLEEHNFDLFIKQIDNKIIILDDGKEWFYKFFNNLIYINNKEFDEKIDEINYKIDNNNETIHIPHKIKSLCDYIKSNKTDIDNIYQTNDVKKLIEEKNEYNKIHNSLIKIKLNFIIMHPYPYFFKNLKLFKEVIMMNNFERFKDYFENDDNFDIYFTYTELFFCNFKIINNILDKLNFKNIEKIIYIQENANEEKLEENPFKIFPKNYYLNRVIKYYNTFKFNLYESVDSWAETQQIIINFNKLPKLKKFLQMIVEFINIKNILIYLKDEILNDDDDEDEDDDEDDDYDYDDEDDDDREIIIKKVDIKKYKIMLNLFNPDKFIIIDEDKIKVNNDNEIEIYKQTINKINDYINCEFEKDNYLQKQKEITKNLQDFNRYFLPELLKSNDNVDLNLLMYFLNNPKNNENIIIGLLNKYKSIL